MNANENTKVISDIKTNSKKVGVSLSGGVSTRGSLSRGRMNIVKGRVISNKAHKTISVLIYYLMKHPKYKKYIRKKSVFKAHDEKGKAKLGDIVSIYETRPLSKTKRWKLFKIVESVKKSDTSVIKKDIALEKPPATTDVRG